MKLSEALYLINAVTCFSYYLMVLIDEIKRQQSDELKYLDLNDSFATIIDCISANIERTEGNHEG